MEAMPIAPAARTAISEAQQDGDVFISPVSAWEIGLLLSKKRLTLGRPVQDWFANLVALPGIQLASLAPGAAIEASFLPGVLHADPADHLLVATARHLDATLITRDASLLAYAADGHVKAIAC
jgi:PIN domain nuclease of toxin-antitoxin system